jgi:hypothetical protein
MPLGRPLMENRTVAHRESTDPLVACPYGDYRTDTGKQMNIGALAAFNRLGPHTLELISRYGAAVCRSRPIERPDVLQAWRISKLAVSTVSRRGVRQVLGAAHCGGVDGAASSVYKVARGLVSLFELLAEFEGSHTRHTVDAILEFVERLKLLEGPREVCAAPTSLIRRVLTHMLQVLPQESLNASLTGDEVHYAALHSMAERICFACQVIRTGILSLPGSGESKGSAPPSVRHTFATARDAAEVGRAGLAAQVAALDQLPRLHWAEDNPDGERILRRLVAVGQSVLHEAAPVETGAWNAFRDLAVDALQQVSAGVAHLEGTSGMKVLNERDFDLFFGPLTRPSR